MKSRVPRTYDEINRKTVLDPIGSVRPPVEEPPSGPPDAVLRATVMDALLASGMTEVGVEVERGRILLRGWVRDAAYAARVVRVVGTAAPDAEIVSRLHVGRAD